MEEKKAGEKEREKERKQKEGKKGTNTPRGSELTD